MRRLHLFEIGDHPACPVVLRQYLTDYLAAIEGWLGAHDVVAPRIAAAMRRAGVNRVVDLCSGSGGPVPRLKARIEAELGAPIAVTLTDARPPPAPLAHLPADERAGLDYLSAPVDARAVPDTLVGMRTLFEGFHHFHPDEARAILQDAVDKRVPIAIVELTERSVPGVAGAALVPLVVMATAPFVRPRTWWRLALTYLVPIGPFVVAWDGFVSAWRTYTPDELRRITATLSGPRYTWDIGADRVRGAPITWAIGTPEA